MLEIERRDPSRNIAEVRDLRLLLAVLRTKTKLVRLRRALSQKYSPDQPRAPAGQSDGGRWVSGGGAGGNPADQSWDGGRASLDAADPETEAPKRTLLDGGGEVLTLTYPIRTGRLGRAAHRRHAGRRQPRLREQRRHPDDSRRADG